MKQRERERERCVCQCSPLTYILQMEKMEIYSFSLALSALLPPPSLIRLSTSVSVLKCERNICIRRRKRFIPFQCYRLSRMLGGPALATNLDFFFPLSFPHLTLLLTTPINLSQSIRQRICFHLKTICHRTV